MVLADKETKIQTSIEGQTNWEKILAAIGSVQGSSPIFQSQPVLVDGAMKNRRKKW